MRTVSKKGRNEKIRKKFVDVKKELGKTRKTDKRKSGTQHSIKIRKRSPKRKQ